MIELVTASCTRETLQQVIARHGGVLSVGQHTASSDGPCCILEARSECLGLQWTDRPEIVGLPDIRALNDAPWSSDVARTEWMIRIATAYTDWRDWTVSRRLAVITWIVTRTVQRMLAELPTLPEDLRVQCRAVNTLEQAAEAAEWAVERAALAIVRAAEEAAAAEWAVERAALAIVRAAEEAAAAEWAVERAALAIVRAAEEAAAAEWAVERAVRNSAKAARAMAEAVTAADADRVLIVACELWIDAANA